jgi:hypothetical protein
MFSVLSQCLKSQLCYPDIDRDVSKGLVNDVIKRQVEMLCHEGDVSGSLSLTIQTLRPCIYFHNKRDTPMLKVKI